MSVTHLIDTITEWAQVNVCDLVKLKELPKDADASDAGYKYSLVTPAAFPMYVPTSDKLPPGIHSPIPSLCVRFLAGQDNIAARQGAVEVQLCFSAWDTGTHGGDVFMPNGDGTFRKLEEAAKRGYFRRSGDGWRDAWNFVDIALRAIESVTHIGGYTIDQSAPIKFGPLSEQEAIPDFYPLWFAWVSFTAVYPIQRNISDIQKFL